MEQNGLSQKSKESCTLCYWLYIGASVGYFFMGSKDWNTFPGSEYWTIIEQLINNDWTMNE